MKSKIKSAFLAPDGFQDQLMKELRGVLSCHGRLVLTDRHPENPPFWAQNCWRNPVLLPIQSISDAAKKLKALQRNWSLYSFQLHRRAQLIQEQLPHVSFKPLGFPAPLPQSPLGSWTLLDRDTLLAASDCSSVFPNGEMQFVEDKKNPPNRAYLKLWEALTLIQEYPRSGQHCIEVGASPGGWTWVLAHIGGTRCGVSIARLWTRECQPCRESVSKSGMRFLSSRKSCWNLETKPIGCSATSFVIPKNFSTGSCCGWSRALVIILYALSSFKGDGDYHLAQKVCGHSR